DRDGVVTITNSVPEMGQGSLTTTPMIIADELDAKLDSVKVEQALANPALYKNPVTGNQLYGGSRGARDHIERWRKAAASARRPPRRSRASGTSSRCRTVLPWSPTTSGRRCRGAERSR